MYERVAGFPLCPLLEYAPTGVMLIPTLLLSKGVFTMNNKPQPGLSRKPNGLRRHYLSLLSAPHTFYTTLRKRSRLRTTAQLLVVGIVALSGVGIIRTPHSKLPVARAQDPGDPVIPPSDTEDLEPGYTVTTPDPNQYPAPTPYASLPFLPTDDPNYFANKAVLDSAPAPSTPKADLWAATGTSNGATRNGAAASGGVAGTSIDYFLDGLDEESGPTLDPPDTHGVMGRTHYIETVNSTIRIYQRVASPGSSSLNNLNQLITLPIEQLMHYT